MLNENPSANELEPWLVVLGDDTNSSLAMWQLSGVPQAAAPSLPADLVSQLSVAIFSSQIKASDYAGRCCREPARVLQLDQTRFLRLMVDCFRRGIRYATLNPGDQTAQSVFVLRDVLKAAKDRFSNAPT
jgi:hypothetical protein